MKLGLFVLTFMILTCCGWFFLAHSAIDLYVKNYSKQTLFISSRLVKIYQTPLPYDSFSDCIVRFYNKINDKKDKFYNNVNNKRDFLHISTVHLIPPLSFKSVFISHGALLQTHRIKTTGVESGIFVFKDICPKVQTIWQLFNLQDTLHDIFVDDDIASSYAYDEKNKKLIISIDDKAENIIIESSEDEDLSNKLEKTKDLKN